MGDLNYTPRTWVADEIVSPEMLNNEVRDPFNELQAPWVSYAPAWTAEGAAPSIGGGTLTGRYQRTGKTVHLRIFLSAGAGTTQGTGFQRISIPFGAAAGEQSLVMKLYTGSDDFLGALNIGPGYLLGFLRVPLSAGDCRLGYAQAGGVNVGTAGNLSISGSYEIA